MITRGGSRSAFTLCLGLGVEPIDESLYEFISAEDTGGILHATPVLFGTIKDGIMELVDEGHKPFRDEIAMSQVGARTFSCRELKACEAIELVSS